MRYLVGGTIAYTFVVFGFHWWSVVLCLTFLGVLTCDLNAVIRTLRKR